MELRFADSDLLLVFDLVLLGFVLVHLGGPNDQCFVMSQDILFDGQLDHLGRFANRALLYLFRTTDLQVLGAAIPTTGDCLNLGTYPVGLIRVRVALTVRF